MLFRQNTGKKDEVSVEDEERLLKQVTPLNEHWHVIQLCVIHLTPFGVGLHNRGKTDIAVPIDFTIFIIMFAISNNTNN